MSPGSALSCVRVNVAALCSWMHKALLYQLQMNEVNSKYVIQALIINALSTDFFSFDKQIKSVKTKVAGAHRHPLSCNWLLQTFENTKG